MAHHRPLARIVRALFWIALITAFVMAILPHPPEVFPPGTTDKAQHVLAFAVLTFLLRIGYPELAIHKVVVLLALFGAFIEIVQMIPELQRDADVFDWLADMAAVATVLLLIALFRRLFGRKPQAAS